MQKSEIIIIDDEVEICELLKNFLVINKYNVEVAFDGYCGVQKMMQRKDSNDLFHYAFIDMHMPFNGYEVIKEFKEKSPSTKLILITSYQNHFNIERTKDIGLSNILFKPFQLKDINSCLL